jgi:heme-degrading monooxygenase HmoA
MPHIPPPLPWSTLAKPDPEREYLVLLTYLPVPRLWKLPRFLRYVRAIQKQLHAAPEGLIGYSLLAKPHRSRYWTLSVWQDASAVEGFIRYPPHRDAMRDLRQALKGFRTIRCSSAGSALPPNWGDALARM